LYNPLYKFWTASLQRQLILGIALVHTILMSIFVLDLVERQRDFLIEQNTMEAKALAKTLAANGVSWILANDTIGIEEIISSQNNFPGLNYAMFVDMEGKILGYSDRTKVNHYIDDPVSLQLLNAPAETIVLIENSALIDVAAPIISNSSQIGWARVGISRQEISKSLALVTQKGLIYMLLAITVGIIFAWFMARGLTAGLNRLSQATHSITKGNRDVSCELNRHDELGKLSNDFNRMLNIINDREEELSTNLSLLNALLNSVPDLVFYKDLNGHYMGCNAAVEKLFGLPEKEVVGKSDYDIFPKEIADFFKEKDQQMLKSGVPQRNEEWVTYPDGERVLLDTLKTPFYTTEGELIGLIGVSRDITLIKEQEEQLRSSRKMDALGKLTGGIAHDYNNLLGIILGFAELLEIKLADQPPLKKYAEQIMNAGQRGASLTKKLLTFSKSNPSKIESININTAIQDAYQMIEKSLTATIEITLHLDKNLSMTQLDSDDFDNALLNICINAAHAMDGTGKLVITTSNEILSSSQVRKLSIAPGDYVSVSISDQGSGMDEETISKIFDPFFSTKGEMGTGLGLSQVYGFVNRAHGAVKIDSKLGEGTTFTLYFPKDMSAEVSEHIEQPVSSHEVLGNPTVLIVDDEASLCELTREILANAEFNALTAQSGEEALNILNNRPVDLLLTDIIMPVMDGHQLALLAKESQPDIKILFISGYSDSSDEEDNNRIQKPIKSAELIKQVENLLTE